jgi:predicted Rossmann fold nucleotide-binding protein DprA/Smf involved in DNA uptake
MRNVVATLSIDELCPTCEGMTANENVAPAQVNAIGNLDILQQKKLALFCSIRCPGNIIIQTYDCMKALREAEITVIGGFHSPMEKECLNILLRGTQPVIICPARSLDNMRMNPEYEKHIKDGRLLFLSPFLPNENRISLQRADLRNHFVAAMADEIFLAYAAPGGKLEELYKTVLNWQKTIFVLENEYNRHLAQTGTQWVNHSNIKSKIKTT